MKLLNYEIRGELFSKSMNIINKQVPCSNIRQKIGENVLHPVRATIQFSIRDILIDVIDTN